MENKIDFRENFQAFLDSRPKNALLYNSIRHLMWVPIPILSFSLQELPYIFKDTIDYSV